MTAPFLILETGQPVASMRRHGSFAHWIRVAAGLERDEAVVVDVEGGDDLPSREGFAGAIVTGSAAGVYDDLPWIPPLIDWLRAARGRTRLVGICFGHQVLAHAFGGMVEKSNKGWGVGLHRYDVRTEEPWMHPRARTIAIPVSHQDQVVAVSADARVIASSGFTPYAGLAWGQDAISFQCHPEFQPDYAAALIEGRRGHRIPEALADEAVASLKRPNDRAVLTAWIRAFLLLTPPPVEQQGSGI